MPWAALALVVVAAVVDGWSASRYGADFRDFVSGGSRFIAGTNLYEGSGAYNGMIGPPFQGLFHAPFAAIYAVNPQLGMAVWCAFSFVALILGIRSWAGVLRVPATSPAVLAAAVAIWFSFYREFQSQNMTAVLLLIAGLSARAMDRRRDGEAGVWLGLAAALKLFPLLALGYFFFRGRWKILLAGVISAAVFTLIPVLRYGVGGFVGLWREWLVSRQVNVWPADFQSQSIPHVVRVLWPGDGSALAATVVFLAIGAGVALLALSRRRQPLEPGEEMAFVTLVSFLASPIAWIAYWILALPVLIMISRDAESSPSARLALVVCGVLGAVIGPLTHGHPRGEYFVIGLLLIGISGYRLRPGAAVSSEH